MQSAIGIAFYGLSPSNLQFAKCRKPAHSQPTKCKITKVGTHRHMEVFNTYMYAIPVLQKDAKCITGCPSSSHFHFWVIYSEEPNHQNLEHVSPLKEPFGFFVKLNSGLHIELKQTILQVLLLTFEFSKLTLELSDFFFREDAS